MKKQVIIVGVLIASLAVYTTFSSKEMANTRQAFVASCKENGGIYAEGALTKMEWRPQGCVAKECDQTKAGKGKYLLTFSKHELAEPTVATLPGAKQELDAPRRRLERGKSYSVCMKKDYELIDYYKSF